MARARTPPRPPLPRFATEDVIREVALLSVGRDGKITVLESLALDSA